MRGSGMRCDAQHVRACIHMLVIYTFPVVGFGKKNKKKQTQTTKHRYAKILIHVVGAPENLRNVSRVKVALDLLASCSC